MQCPKFTCDDTDESVAATSGSPYYRNINPIVYIWHAGPFVLQYQLENLWLIITVNTTNHCHFDISCVSPWKADLLKVNTVSNTSQPCLLRSLCSILKSLLASFTSPLTPLTLQQLLPACWGHQSLPMGNLLNLIILVGWVDPQLPLPQPEPPHSLHSSLPWRSGENPWDSSHWWYLLWTSTTVPHLLFFGVQPEKISSPQRHCSTEAGVSVSQNVCD